MKTNFHTHTSYCDGKNTAEEMVKSAIEKGFTHLGFSDHSYTPFDMQVCLSREKTKVYIEKINELKEKYKNEISIYLGLEMDYYSEEDLSCYDYVIASVHYVEKNGVYYPVDLSKKVFRDAINEAWNGDVYAFIESYYELEKNLINRFDFDIVGHIDLISKFNEMQETFDENNERYKEASLSAVDELLKHKKIFEVNTGAISRGYKTLPYPSETILRRIKDGNGKVIITADAHSVDALDTGFDIAQKMIDKIGVTQIWGI